MASADKKDRIVPPSPHATSLTIGKASKPIVIPFDGQYWYFKAPSKRPGPRAHIAHGKATHVNVHSTDSAPLLMEAYQNLGTSIDLGCCSEIDVAITNADVRPGTIALGIRLADSTSVGEPSQDLGDATIVSSKAAQIPLNRPPVEEVLRFPISRPTTIQRFNEITIVFLSARERARGGAKGLHPKLHPHPQIKSRIWGPYRTLQVGQATRLMLSEKWDEQVS